MSLDPTKKYISARALDEFLQELGYVEVLTADCLVYYVKQNTEIHRHLPRSLTISYPTLAVDGTLWHAKDLVFDLIDRLSDSADDDIIMRAIRRLDS